MLLLLQSIEIGGFRSTWSTQGTHFWLPKVVRAPMFWIMECPRHTCFELPEHSGHPCLSYQAAPSYHKREWSALVTQIKIMEHSGHWKNKCPQCSGHYKNYRQEHSSNSNIESKDFFSTWSTPGNHFLTYRTAPDTHVLNCRSILGTNVLNYQSAPSLNDKEWRTLVTWIERTEHYGLSTFECLEQYWKSLNMGVLRFLYFWVTGVLRSFTEVMLSQTYFEFNSITSKLEICLHEIEVGFTEDFGFT